MFAAVAVYRNNPGGNGMFLDLATVSGVVIAAGIVGLLVYVCGTAGCGK